MAKNYKKKINEQNSSNLPQIAKNNLISNVITNDLDAQIKESVKKIEQENISKITKYDVNEDDVKMKNCGRTKKSHSYHHAKRDKNNYLEEIQLINYYHQSQFEQELLINEIKKRRQKEESKRINDEKIEKLLNNQNEIISKLLQKKEKIKNEKQKLVNEALKNKINHIESQLVLKKFENSHFDFLLNMRQG